MLLCVGGKALERLVVIQVNWLQLEPGGIGPRNSSYLYRGGRYHV